MSLLREIQQSLSDKNCDISSVFLKLRFLTSRFESKTLNGWAKYEIKGYPETAKLPDYREVKLLYTANFSGKHRELNNSAIDPDDIKNLNHVIGMPKCWSWDKWRVWDSIITIDTDLQEPGNRIFRLPMLEKFFHNKYEDMKCISISGIISKGEFATIRHIVLGKIMDFTIELEKEFPKIIDVTINKNNFLNSKDKEDINETITNNFNFYGDNSRVNLKSEDNSHNISNRNKSSENTPEF